MKSQNEKWYRTKISELWPGVQEKALTETTYNELLELHDELIALRNDKELNTRDDVLSRALVHELAGFADKAHADYRHLIETTPKDAEPYSRAASLFLKEGRLPEALEHVQKAIELALFKIYDIELRGKIFTAMGRHEDAEKDKQEVANYHEQEAAKWDDPNHYYNYK